MNLGKLSNAQRAAVARVMADRVAMRYALVTNYDPATHMAQVNIMPEEIQSGWLPIAVHWVGNGFGLYVGLDVGNQVVVAHIEGDPNAGIIIGRLNSDSEVPPSVPAGEGHIVHTSGSFLKFTNDGKVSVNSASDMDFNSGRDINMTAARNVTVLDGNSNSLYMKSSGSELTLGTHTVTQHVHPGVQSGSSSTQKPTG
jgi:phage baseplate assembly protein V